jgi:hypothetical protein
VFRILPRFDAIDDLPMLEVIGELSLRVLLRGDWSPEKSLTLEEMYVLLGLLGLEPPRRGLSRPVWFLGPITVRLKLRIASR